MDIPRFEELSDLERFALAEQVLASIAHPERLPVAVQHGAELDRRWAAFERGETRALDSGEFWGSVTDVRKS